ncbi:MAG: hypothetical protein ACOZQL_10045 [Myxococcota bacterium]
MLLTALTLLMTTSAPLGFSRNQDRVSGLVRWGAQVVVLASRPCVLDLAAATCAPVKVPGLDVVQTVAGDTTRFALGTTGGKPRVLRERAGTWSELETPALGDAWDAITAGASGERLAFVWSIVDRAPRPPRAQAGLALWDGARWTHAKLEHGSQGLPQVVRFIGGRWLFGYSCGEWGGSLWTLDAKGTPVRVLPELNDPVQALVPLPGGHALVGTGLAHLSTLSAEVGVLAADGGWTRLAKVDGFDGEKEADQVRQNWTLKLDSLEGADIDAQGRVHVWTGSQGVARLDGETMVVVTPGWPQDVHVYGRGMLLEGDLAVLATFDGGVLLWKLGTTDYRRVPLLKPQR